MRPALQRWTINVPRTASLVSRRSFARSSATYLRSATCQTSVQIQKQSRTLHQSSRALEAVAAEVEQSNDDASATITRFGELEKRGIVHANVVQAITKDMGLDTMTDVQTRTINAALNGDDIIAQARTGTGKTLAFLLPVLQNIISVDPQLAQSTGSRRRPRTTADDIRALIISPTRELAEQIGEEARKLVRRTGLIVQTAVGGTHKRAGLQAIQQQGCHILVGTPGRLKDILTDPYSRVEAPDLSALVFDEADRLLDQGFWPEIQEIMRLLPTPQEKNRQTMMFSATVPKEVVDLVRRTLKPGFQFVKCVRDDEQPTHERVPQRLVKTKGLENGLPVLMELCAKAIAASKEPGSRPFKAIVYFNSTAEVSLASEMLMNLTSPEAAGKRDAFGYMPRSSHPWAPTRIFTIHAKLTQQQRTRASELFRNCASGILLSSDVTARGMDFPNVSHVVQVGLPSSGEQYVHRIGRTGRAGKEGEGWLIINDLETFEARKRLSGLPLKRDESLVTATLDLTQPAQVPAGAGEILNMYQKAMRDVHVDFKSKVYKATLGVFGWLPNKQQLVDSMNNLARYGWGMSTPPSIPPILVQRLGLARMQGINVGHDSPPPSQDGFGRPSSSGSSFGGFRQERGRSFGESGRDGGRSFRGAGRDSGFRGRRNNFGDFSPRSSQRSSSRPQPMADDPFA